MAKKSATFTIDWEPFFCFKRYSQFWEKTNPLVEEPTMYLLDILRRHQIKAIWYAVGWLVDKRPDLVKLIKINGHIIGDHTYYHSMPENEVTSRNLFRGPRWKGEKRLFSGGFWLRLMPYWWLKREVLKTGIFFIHPHDLLFSHPKEGGWTRQIGLKTSRDKLERLCRELEWNEPSKD